MNTQSSAQTFVATQLRHILFDLSGFEIDESNSSVTFLELGFDSLFLIQFSTAVKNELSVEVSFRQMLDDTATFVGLVDYIANQIPADQIPAEDVTTGQSNQGSAPVDTVVVQSQTTASHPHNNIKGANGGSTSAAGGYPAIPQIATDAAFDQPTPILPMPAMNGAPNLHTQQGASINSDTTGLENILAQQLQVMSMQLSALAGQPPAMAPSPIHEQNGLPAAPQSRIETPSTPGVQISDDRIGGSQELSKNGATNNATPATVEKSSESDAEFRPKSSKEMKPFGAIARIETKRSSELEPQQQNWLNDFIVRYNTMTRQSKDFTAKWHKYHADPRVVSGFKSKTKELIYPIVAERTEGCRIWDLDGNEYVDALNGFGSNFFGYANPDITQAVVDQMWKGVEIGPQCQLTGEAAKLICEFTGMERVGFCNTGSEAVMGAMRIARTVTGRRLIVTFSGSYHGIFDEVIVRSLPNGKSMPAAPGIMPSSVENVLVLEYGTDESLQIIRDRINEFAAVMVEPVQSRRPEFQPVDFLHELREITAENDVPFIFDEVITGFRTGPGGAQEHFGIQADIATYGKVVGGGMHIGVVAGRAKYMDALDGGPWQYGDESVPEIGVTYFAGTFVRHPASIAACLAALKVLKAEGADLQKRVNGQTAYLVSELRNFFQDRCVPIEVNFFSSLWRMTFSENIPYSEILFYLIRMKGVHIYDGFPCFLTMAHTDNDVEQLLDAIKKSVLELQNAGLLPSPAGEVAQTDFFVKAS